MDLHAVQCCQSLPRLVFGRLMLYHGPRDSPDVYLVLSESVCRPTVPAVYCSSRKQSVCCRAADTSKSVSLRAGEKYMIDSHLLPGREGATIIYLALCGSREPRRDSLVAWNASWHHCGCERIASFAESMSWSRNSAKRASDPSEATAYARGVQVSKDRMRQLPRWIGAALGASFKGAEGAGDFAAPIRHTEIAREQTGRPSNQSILLVLQWTGLAYPCQVAYSLQCWGCP
jgi:hypothetical protein